MLRRDSEDEMCSVLSAHWLKREDSQEAIPIFLCIVRKKDVVMITSEGWRGRSKGLWRCWVSASPAVSGCLGSYSWHLITNHWSSSSSSLITDHHYHHCGYQWVSGDITHPSLLLILSPDVSLSLYQITSSHPWHKLWKKVQASRILYSFAIFTHKNQINSINYFSIWRKHLVKFN